MSSAPSRTGGESAEPDASPVAAFLRFYAPVRDQVVAGLRQRLGARTPGVDPHADALIEVLEHRALDGGSWASLAPLLERRDVLFVEDCFSRWASGMGAFRDAVLEHGPSMEVVVGLGRYTDQVLGQLGAEQLRRERGRVDDSQRQIRALVAAIDASSDAMLAKDLDGIILSWNRGAEEVYGWSADEAVGRNVVDLIVPEEDRENHDGVMASLRAGQDVPNHDVTRVRKDGSLVRVSLAVSSIRDDEGRPIAASATARDVTEARRNEHRLSAILDASLLGIVILDADGVIQRWNRGATALLGWERDQVRGTAIRDLVVGQTGSFDKAWAELVGSRRTLQLRRADGGAQPVELGVERFDEHASYACFLLDRSALHEALDELEARARELERSNEELVEFAYVASHDLQEPLRMVASFSELLLRRYGEELDERGQMYAQYAVDGARRMQGLVNDLLNLGRVDSQGRARAAVDPAPLVRAALEDLGPDLDGVEVDVGELPPVMADPQQFTRVITNLVDNAAKFRSELPPRVVIRAAPAEGGFVRFTIEDNGIGIDPRHQDRIFDMFRRLHGRDRYPGSGVGLAIARRIVHRHGGRIWLESTPGQGSTFSFTIPGVP